MSAIISPETHIKPEFQTDIVDCISFAIENHGTTMLQISFDKGNTWIKVKPDTLREFDAGPGDVFLGDMYGKFGEVYTLPGEEVLPARNEAVVLKTLFVCPNKR